MCYSSVKGYILIRSSPSVLTQGVEEYESYKRTNEDIKRLSKHYVSNHYLSKTKMASLRARKIVLCDERLSRIRGPVLFSGNWVYFLLI